MLLEIYLIRKCSPEKMTRKKVSHLDREKLLEVRDLKLIFIQKTVYQRLLTESVWKYILVKPLVLLENQDVERV